MISTTSVGQRSGDDWPHCRYAASGYGDPEVAADESSRGLRNGAHEARSCASASAPPRHPFAPGLQFFHNVAHQAAATQQVAAEPLHELLETRFAWARAAS